MERERVLAAVRTALRDVVPPARPATPGPDAEATPDGEDALTARFVAEARAVGTVVHEAATAAEAAAVILGIAPTEQRAPHLVAWVTPLVREVVDLLASQQSALRVTLLDPSTSREAADATIGLTEADAAIATSGTLLLGAADHRHRGASLLPPVHVALVPRHRVLPDLATALRERRPGLHESCVTLVTGPSRTADIEKKLVLGVHGPCALHVILLADR